MSREHDLAASMRRLHGETAAEEAKVIAERYLRAGDLGMLQLWQRVIDILVKENNGGNAESP